MINLGQYAMVKTRFNPTTNGNLHLGHLFTLLVNEYFAHSRGGEFYIRFDDDNIIANPLSDEEMKQVIESQKWDIEWLDVKVDGFSYQSDILSEIKEKIKSLGYDEMPEVKPGDHKTPLVIRMGTTYTAFPYLSQQTIERVFMDYMLGITHVIRGDDFITEYSLYCYFCQLFNYLTPEFIFLPRLISLCGDISKTNGGYKISDFREEGYSPKQLKRMMANACLIYPNNDWEIYNIKSNPRINL